MNTEKWIGIDLGGQTTGSTAICYLQKGFLQFDQAPIRSNADDWIFNWLGKHQEIESIFIDAPLSLPAAYFDKGRDFMFREADRQVGAMSPMFLGGLTARAIRLKYELEKKDLEIKETYPAHLEKELFGHKTPKKQSIPLERLDELSLLSGYGVSEVKNRHQYDALLAWVSGWRHYKQQHKVFGDQKEGVIII